MLLCEVASVATLRRINCCVARVTIIAMVFALTSCSKDHLDPSQIGRFRPAPAVNIILDSLGVAEEGEVAYEGAEDPRPADVVGREQDYVFNSGDVIRIALFELLQEGTAYVDYFVDSESGNISGPEIGQIQTAGLTETQLEDELRDALSPGILKNPTVTVALQNSVSQVFTIIGDGVTNPGRYGVPRYDFRLLDALAVAGSARQFNVSYIYVTRRLTGQEQPADELNAERTMSLKPVEASQEMQSDKESNDVPQDDDNEEMLELIQPVFSAAGATGLVIALAEIATEEQLEALAIPETIGAFDQTDNINIADGGILPETQQQQGRVEWVFRDGKWVPVRVEDSGFEEAQQQVDLKPRFEPEPQRQEKAKPVKPEMKPLPENYGWDDIQSAGIGTRVIRIAKDKLYGGDPRYNIIIKPQDTITVQLDIIGEFYVLGNVNNQGIIPLTGRPMTLKMAIAAAGGLGPLAWPKKCEVVRRIGEKKEEIVMVDLEKIASGTQPDFFIKPNDIINVGTHGISRFMAIVRNAFRASYGFGFIYDRNFGALQFRELVEESLNTKDVFNFTLP